MPEVQQSSANSDNLSAELTSVRALACHRAGSIQLSAETVPSLPSLQLKTERHPENHLLRLLAPSGEPISGWYHQFRGLTFESAGGSHTWVAGQHGATWQLLRVSDASLRVEEVPSGYHDIFLDRELGALIAKSGANLWILDPETGLPAHSKGYHEIFRAEDGILMGQTGPDARPIKFQKRAELMVGNWLQFVPPVASLALDPYFEKRG